MAKKEVEYFANFPPKKAAMLKALSVCMGIVTTAAEKVGMSARQHYNWLRDDSEYKEAVEQIANNALDFAESQLFKVITGYTLPETKVFNSEFGIVTHDMLKHYGPDTTAIIFFLKTKGKHRGYIEPQRVQLTNGEEESDKEFVIKIKRGE